MNTMKATVLKVQGEPRSAGRYRAARAPYAERTELGNVAASGPERSWCLYFADKSDGRLVSDSWRYPRWTRTVAAAAVFRSCVPGVTLPAVFERYRPRKVGCGSERWKLSRGYARPQDIVHRCRE